MRIRIHWRTPRSHIGTREVALGFAALLTPSALVAFTIGFWSFAAELQWTGVFFVSSGPLAHWQVWLILAGILLACARILGSYGSSAFISQFEQNSEIHKLLSRK
jgi:hypothetical protein